MSDRIQHIDSERMEQYAMEILPEQQVAELEQHLLICGPCQGLLAKTDAYVASMRSAARRMREEGTDQAFEAGASSA
jgi:hypothetical protein